MVIKRGMSPGFAGIDNPLYYLDKTLMLFGDARSFVGAIVREISGARAVRLRSTSRESRTMQGSGCLRSTGPARREGRHADRRQPRPHLQRRRPALSPHLQAAPAARGDRDGRAPESRAESGGGPPRPGGPGDHLLRLGQPLRRQRGAGQRRLDGRHRHARSRRRSQSGPARAVRPGSQRSRRAELPGGGRPAGSPRRRPALGGGAAVEPRRECADQPRQGRGAGGAPETISRL